MAVTAPDAKTLADELWASLNEDNKVSLFVQYVDLASGERDTGSSTSTSKLHPPVKRSVLMALTDPIIQFQKERASVPFQPPHPVYRRDLSSSAGRGSRPA